MELDESSAAWKKAGKGMPPLGDIDPTHVTPAQLHDAPGSGSSDGRDDGDPPCLYLKQYRNCTLIAKTALSRTWRAYDVKRKSDVVVKELHGDLLLHPQFLGRFQSEYAFTAWLSHANVVVPLMAHFEEPPYCYVMPYIDGEHLDDYCTSHNLSISERIRLCLPICQAITHAHDNRVVHRDLKPNNILVGKDGRPQLIDFGLAREISSVEVASQIGGNTEGTPGYMSPEQADGREGDARTDVYSLGVVLYELLTGHLPIKPTRDVRELLRRIREDAPTRPTEWTDVVDWELEALLLKTLEKRPQDRYASIADLREDLENYLACRPLSILRHNPGYVARKWIRRNRVGVAIGSSFAVLVIVFCIIALWLTVSNARAVAETAALGRHKTAIVAAQLQGRNDDPFNAARTLWREHFYAQRHANASTRRTKFALWAFYQRYPCIWHVGHSVGERVLTPKEHMRSRVRCSPDSKWIATVLNWEDESGRLRGRVAILDAVSGALQSEVNEPAYLPRCVAFAPDGRSLWVGDEDGQVRCFALPSESGELDSQPASTIPIGDHPITVLAISPDGHLLATGTDRDTIDIVTIGQGSSTPLTGWPKRISTITTDLAFSPDSTQLAASFRELTVENPQGVCVWRIADGGCVGEVRERACWSLAWAPDGQGLHVDGKAGLHKLRADGSLSARLGEARPWGLRAIDLARASDRTLIAHAAGDCQIGLYDLGRRMTLPIHGFHFGSVADQLDLSFDPDGVFVASTARDGVRLWRVTGSLARPWPSGTEDIPCAALALSQSGTVVCVARGGDLSVTATADERARAYSFWAPSDSSPAAGLEPFCETGLLCGPVPSLSDKYVVYSRQTSENEDATVIIGTTDRSGTVLAEASLGPKVVSALYWLSDVPATILVGTKAGTLFRWRPNLEPSAPSPPEALRPLWQFDTACSGITISHDGLWCAACAENAAAKPESTRPQVCVWRVGRMMAATGAASEALRPDYCFSTHPFTWRVNFVRGADGTLLLATSGSAREIRLWEAFTGVERRPLCGHQDGIFRCFALDEQTLVTSSRDRSVRIWDVPTREELCLLYESPWDSPAIAVRNGRIAIADATGVTVADTREIDAFIAANRNMARRLYEDGTLQR